MEEYLQEVLVTKKAILGNVKGVGMEMDTKDVQKNKGRIELKMLDQNVISEVQVDQSGFSLRTKGKWKRVCRRLKGRKRTVSDDNKKNEGMKGNKRFQFIDEEDQEKTVNLQSKRARTDSEQTVTHIAKVGVASLK